MTYDELSTLAATLAPEFGGRVVPDRSGYGRACLEGTDWRILLHLAWSGSRIEISGSPMVQPLNGAATMYAPSITVSSARQPLDIAREIRRRLLPKYSEAEAHNRERRAQDEADLARREAQATSHERELVAAGIPANGPEAERRRNEDIVRRSGQPPWKDNRREITTTFSLGPNIRDGHGRITADGNRARMELTVPADLADAIVRTIADWSTSR